MKEVKKILSNDELIEKARAELNEGRISSTTYLLLIERLAAAERKIKLLVDLCGNTGAYLDEQIH